MSIRAHRGDYRNSYSPATPGYTPIPEELTARPQWVAWRFGKKRSSGKPAKDPIDPKTGYPGDATDPEMWRGHESALAYSGEQDLAGVGFAFSENDPFTGIDYDDCGDRATGYVHPAVLEDLERLGNPPAEWSPGGRGIKTIVKGTKPGERCKQTVTPWGGDFEMYGHGRFFTITGDKFAGSADTIVEAQEAVEDLYHGYFPESVEVERSAPLPDPIDLTDGELLEKARNADRLGWKFTALYDGGDLSHSNNDASRADNDLMMQLAFWTGRDADRMERFFSESALGERDKWKTRPDYRRRTIAHAIKKTKAVYEPERHRPQETKARDRIREMVSYAILLHGWAEKAGRSDAGATDFFGYLGLLRKAHGANTLEIDVSIRDYMEAAGIADFTTALNSLDRLANPDTHRLVAKVRDGGGGNAARYRLRGVPKPKHIEIRKENSIGSPPCAYNVCAGLLAPLAGAYLIRNSSPEMPEYDKNGRKIPKGPAPLVKSIGKAAAMVAYVVSATAPLFENGTVSPEFVALRTGISRVNLKRRHAKKLAAAGLVETVDGGYRVSEDVTTALKEELRVSGSFAAANHQRRRHDRQRRAQEILRLSWVGHDAERIAAETGFDRDEIAAVVTPPDKAPTAEEMDLARLAKSATGTYSDLERQAEHFPEVYTADAEPQHPIGHAYPEPREEATDEHSAPSEPVQRGTAPPTTGEAVQRPRDAQDTPQDGTPCHHSGLGHVYPGGNGCYICDPDHPLRQHERKAEVVSLDTYRRSRERIA